jgi:hypothetical protein
MNISETHILADGDWISVTQVCRASQIDVAVVVELAEYGLVSPRDLGLNGSGAALAVELLEARSELERRVRALERCVRAASPRSGPR